MNDTREFSLPLRVYIEDTDAGGIVYYVNYLKYIERARTEFMRSLDMDRAAIFNNELMFVVSDVSVSYHRPAKLDDELEATAALASVGGASLKLRQCVRRGADLIAEAAVSLACVSPETLAPRRIPKEMLATLRAACDPHNPHNPLGE
ncbi:tol-pal system-associated acyl-CoA thioesterase [Congregibacter sp.]|uniref:tol-pal system-associated acyl-CoA thioesterase n=1 Tax=Congregibacter sp. TaxID=2744308 RepID=UPI003F6AA14E